MLSNQQSDRLKMAEGQSSRSKETAYRRTSLQVDSVATTTNMNKDLAQALAETAQSHYNATGKDKAESMLSISQQYEVNLEGGKYGVGGKSPERPALQGIPERSQTIENKGETIDANAAAPADRAQNSPVQMIQSGEADPRLGH